MAMLESHWLLVAGFAMSMTVAWLFLPKRITTTSALAGAAWAYAALTGGQLTRITEDGTEIAVSIGELQYFCTLLAVLSFLALILYRFDAYPPGGDDPINPDERPARGD